MTGVTFTSSAPGKVVLLGEYAVVGGAPALVAAVNRRARVRLATSEQPGWTIDSPELGIVGARATRTNDGGVRWDDPLMLGRLGLVGAVLELVTGSDVADSGVSGTGASGIGVCSTDVSGIDVSGIGVSGIGVSGIGVSGVGVSGTGVTSTAPVPSARISLDTGELYAPAADGSAPGAVAAVHDGEQAGDAGELDTADPRHTPGRPRLKLGLGSSAALTVALAGALAAAAGRREPEVTELLAAHRLTQGGRGSGIDIAAALTGGLLRFERTDSGVRTQRLTLPAELTWCAVWTGCPASTGTFLARIADWRAAEPDRHDRLMARLAQTSSDGIDAVARRDTAAVLAAVDSYARLLQQLDQASGADIVSAEHRWLGTLAAASGVSYKSCGAGGGDVGVAITIDPDRLVLFGERARQDGFHTLDLAVDPLGLLVDRRPLDREPARREQVRREPSRREQVGRGRVDRDRITRDQITRDSS